MNDSDFEECLQDDNETILRIDNSFCCMDANKPRSWFRKHKCILCTAGVVITLLLLGASFSISMFLLYKYEWMLQTNAVLKSKASEQQEKTGSIEEQNMKLVDEINKLQQQYHDSEEQSKLLRQEVDQLRQEIAKYSKDVKDSATVKPTKNGSVNIFKPPNWHVILTVLSLIFII